MNFAMDALPIKVYRQIAGSGQATMPAGVLAKFRVYLPDRPGSLADFASVIADSTGNIAFFHYDRSIDGSRVAVEVQLGDEAAIRPLVAALREKQFSFENLRSAQDEVAITSIENILEIKVRLVDKPGTLAAFARLLAQHNANVIYMLYDEGIDPGSADIALVTKDPREINTLMGAMNVLDYHYRVIYRGSDEQAAERIIGLNMIERFFHRLQRLLPSSDVAEIKSLVESSRDLQQDLAQFATEAGKNLEAGDVFETVLTFASRSRSKTRDKFSVAEMRPLRFPGNVELLGFRLPTSENFYLFRSGNELTMIDAGHGVYYEDIKRLLFSRGLDPAKVTRMYVTHPDTDHVGTAGYFEQEFGTAVYMHAGSVDVIRNMNRAHGAVGNLLSLNKYYTRLSIRFTECRFPSHPHYFHRASDKSIAAFKAIDTFSIGPLAFDVLESHGGHTPGLVFFLNREFGLLFTSDYLLNLASLTTEDKENLGIYRYLLTNPNSDSRVYKTETMALKELIAMVDNEVRPRGVNAIIFPGHGLYYQASELNQV